jgi:uncharacterized RDD family membrane protein YckC
MACPVCGEVCRCVPQSTPVVASAPCRFRFQPECTSQSIDPWAPTLIDPEAPDCSEQRFMASLDETSRPVSVPRFVIDREEKTGSSDSHGSQEGSGALDEIEATSTPEQPGAEGGPEGVPLALESAVSLPSAPDASSEKEGAIHASREALSAANEGDSFWKDEVAARLSHYRARRKPRPPKYPSLRLRFDPLDRKPDSEIRVDSRLISTRQEVVAVAAEPIREADNSEPYPGLPPVRTASGAVESARIIEFPRSYYASAYTQVATGDELADPVVDRPRIVEVPEIEMPVPALGGITLEPEVQEPERRPGFEIPLQSASKRQRLLASACDAAIVLGACAVFGYIFLKIAGVPPPLATFGGTAGTLIVFFWAAYQYLLLTYSGSTPGLRLARLHLSQFDGAPVDRRRRRWRAIASLLSALSLGLGYAWCFLDEDALCWHDRITRTYLAPLKQ